MSSRDAGTENFPVASRLLPAWARPHVMAFYAFARAADDIADAPELAPETKLARLEQLSAALESGTGDSHVAHAHALALRQSLDATAVTSQHAQDLLKAFMRDARNPVTKDWTDLMAYCALSAAPVGRHLIDLLGGLREGGDYAPSDALCAALQILNHIQDVKDDARDLGRVYVPADWMAAAGVTLDHLTADRASPELHGVLARMLDGVDALLDQAQPLPRTIKSKALAREAGGILTIARRLSKALRGADPLAGRVELSKPHAALCFLWGALTARVGYR